MTPEKPVLHRHTKSRAAGPAGGVLSEVALRLGSELAPDDGLPVAAAPEIGPTQNVAKMPGRVSTTPMFRTSSPISFSVVPVFICPWALNLAKLGSAFDLNYFDVE